MKQTPQRDASIERDRQATSQSEANSEPKTLDKSEPKTPGTEKQNVPDRGAGDKNRRDRK